MRDKEHRGRKGIQVREPVQFMRNCPLENRSVNSCRRRHTEDIIWKESPIVIIHVEYIVISCMKSGGEIRFMFHCSFCSGYNIRILARIIVH